MKIQARLGARVVMEAVRDADHWNILGVEVEAGSVSELKRFPFTFSDDGLMAIIHSYRHELPDHRERASWGRIAARL